MEFENANDAVKWFACRLYNADAVETTNEENTGTYKNKLYSELTQQFFVIRNSRDVLVTWKKHKYYKWWMYGEILSELLNLDPPIMYKYRNELFSQHYKLLDDGRMQYSYGNRFVEYSQFVNVYRKLKKNINSKRAVIAIYTPYDTEPSRQDVPCTTMYHFIHRDGKLNMTIFYRSWDFFGGFKTYDFALSSFILQAFCSWLQVEPGRLAFYVNSLHVYNRDKEMLLELIDEVSNCDIKSNTLFVDGDLDIDEFYNELRTVKLIEEYAFSKNFDDANKLVDKELKLKITKDIAREYIARNKNAKHKK